MKTRLTAFFIFLAIVAAVLAYFSYKEGYVDSDHLGVRVINIPGINGVQQKTLESGKYHLCVPELITIYKIPRNDIKIEMMQEAAKLLREAGRTVETTRTIGDAGGQEQEQKVAQAIESVTQETKQESAYKIVIHDRPTTEQSVRVKTADGNDAWVDVTVAFKVMPDEAYKVATFFRVKNGNGATVHELRSMVESLVRGVMRTRLGELTTEELLRASDRARKIKGDKDADTNSPESIGAIDELNDILDEFGLEIVSLGAPAVTPHPAYEDILSKKRIAEEEREEYVAYGERAKQEKETKVNQARGGADSMIELARGHSQRILQEADAALAAKKSEAEAMRVKYNMMADGIAAQTEALSAPGGDKHVGLAIAETLQGKRIVIVPSEGAFNMLDLNDVIQSYGAAKALKEEAGKTKSADHLPPGVHDGQVGEQAN